MANVKESVKASLVGVEQERQLSQQVKSNFMQHARVDEDSGEYYMSEEQFINAIAPKNEDYVSLSLWNRRETEETNTGQGLTVLSNV